MTKTAPKSERGREKVTRTQLSGFDAFRLQLLHIEDMRYASYKKLGESFNLFFFSEISR